MCSFWLSDLLDWSNSILIFLSPCPFVLLYISCILSPSHSIFVIICLISENYFLSSWLLRGHPELSGDWAVVCGVGWGGVLSPVQCADVPPSQHTRPLQRLPQGPLLGDVGPSRQVRVSPAVLGRPWLHLFSETPGVPCFPVQVLQCSLAVFQPILLLPYGLFSWIC